MFVILPSYLEILLPVSILIWLLFFITRYKRMKVRSDLLVCVVIISTIALFSIQVASSNDIQAYEQGQVLLRDQTWNLTLEPGGVIQIGQISNYYVLTSTSIRLQTNSDVHFYLVDENSPSEHYNVQNLTTSDTRVYVELPYLHTEENIIANWSMYLENPSQSESVTVVLEWIHIEDNLVLERLSVLYWPYMPIRILSSIWIFSSLGFIANTKRASDNRKDELARISGYSAVLLAIVGGMFLWSLAGLPLILFSPALIPSTFLWILFAETTFSFNIE